MRAFRIVVCFVIVSVVIASLVSAPSAWAQTSSQTLAQTNGPQSSSASATATVPRLIQIKGSIHDQTGKPLTGNVALTFTLYKDSTDQVAVWHEVQNVQLDSSGRYTVLLGSTNEAGLPLEIFSSGEARWLGVRPDGQAEQPRILFLSVAYALKAADTEMLGGKPASAFVLAESLYALAQSVGSTPASSANLQSGSKIPSATLGASPLLVPPTEGGCNPAVNSNGVANPGTIALFTDGCDVDGSVIFQSPTNWIGIGNTNPAALLDVSGTANIAGSLSASGGAVLPSTGAATSPTNGFNSATLDMQASSWISGSPIIQDYQWLAEAIGNSPNPSGSLNLLYGTGTSPTETGLYIATNGRINFAPGQAFPIPAGGVSNGMLANNSITVTAGSGLSGGGTVALGGTVTLTNSSPSSGGTVTQVSAGTGLAGGPITTTGALNLAIPVTTSSGGTGTTSTLTGFVRGGNPFTAAEISGDCSTSGSNVITCTKSNGSTLGAMAFLGSPVPRANGGLNSTTPGSGLLRDGTTPTAAEISGDCSTSGSNAITCTKSSGAPFGSGAFANIANYAPLAGATFTGAVTIPQATIGATLPATGGLVIAPTKTATTAQAFVSNPMDIEASVWNTNILGPSPYIFRWQAEPFGNNTANTGETLNLLYGIPGLVKETGISFSVVNVNGVNNGLLNFGPGQTYPGLFATDPQAATYTATAADFASCKTIPVASGTFTITLVASATQPSNGQCVFVINYGSGVVTIANNGQNLNGAASSLTLAAGSATAPTGAFIVSDGTNYEAQLFGTSSGGGGGGGGTVTSVGLNVNGAASSGIFAATGTPVTGAGTLNINLTGTTGGIPYFSTANVLTSSGALTGIVRGGSPPTASEISGDATTSGSNVLTVKGLNNKLLSSLATGILKNTTGTGVPSIATFSDVTALWTTGGTCSSTTFLRGDGQCQSPSGAGTVTSSGYSSGTPLAAFSSATNITPATSGNVVSLFTGCSGSQYLGADGACHNASGSGTVTSSGYTSGAPLAAFSSATNVTPATFANVVSLFSGCSGSQYLGADGSCHSSSGSGTVTNIATSFPITGGPINTTGTIGLTSCSASGQTLLWNGSAWACGTPSGGGGIAGFTDGIAYFSSSNNITSTNPANNGQILIGSTSSAPVLSTLTAGSNVTITNGPGSITISASGSGGGNPSFPFFVTGGEHTGANQAAAKNVNKLWGFLLPYNVTTTQVTYDVSTVDNTANLYDLGIYNNSGQLVLNIGPTAGTSFAPSKKFLTFNWLQGSTTLSAGRYYIGFTTNCASACGAVAAGATYVSYAVALSAGATAGGTLASSVTPPADVWNTGNQPTLVIH